MHRKLDKEAARQGWNPRRDDRGSMLIVAIGVLTLLSILGVAFASLMLIEKEASRNYIAGLRADLLCQAAVARSLAELKHPDMAEGYSPFTDPWVYKNKDKNELAAGTRIEDNPDCSYKGTVSESTYTPGGDNYRVKVLDTASQINLNLDIENAPKIFEALGYALLALPQFEGKDNPVINLSYEKKVVGPGGVTTTVTVKGGAAIDAYRKTLPNQRFSSKSQLRDLYELNDDKDSYAIIRDFITANSWLDMQTVVGSYGDSPYKIVTYTAQPRYPVNVNTAPKSVLYSLLAPIAGRFKYIYTDVGKELAPVDENDDLYSEHSPANEELKLLAEPIWVYIPRLGDPSGTGKYDAAYPAAKIAGKIDEARKSKPFKSQSDLMSFFKDPSRLPNDDLPGVSEIEVYITPDGKLDIAGKTEDDVKNELVNDRAFKRYFKEAVRSMLISNFNPNALPNSFNPNIYAFLPVDKGGLWWRKPDKIKARAHTTEFCFASMGFFEIISLGRVEAPDTKQVSANRRVVVAERKLRTVIRVYDAVRHTSQKEFAELHPEVDEDEIDQIVYRPEPLNLNEVDPPPDPQIEGDSNLGYFEIKHRTKRADGAPGEPLFYVPYHKNFDAEDDAAFPEFDDEYFSGPDSPYNVADGLNGAGKDSIPKSGVLDTRDHDFFQDGVNFSSLRQNIPKVCVYRVGSPDSKEPSANRTSSDPVNVTRSQGSISFWYKPEFDADAKIFCGYFSVTHADRFVRSRGTTIVTLDRDGEAPALECTGKQRDPDGHGYRGTQMYMFKNTEGTIRIVRLNYQASFGSPDDYWCIDTNRIRRATPIDPDDLVDRNVEHNYFPPYTTWRHPEALYPGQSEYADEEWWPENYDEPPHDVNDPEGPWRDVPDEKQVFERITPTSTYGRVDLTVNLGDVGWVEGWRAHEWHHICVSWNDQNDNKLLQLFIDGKKVGKPTCSKPLGQRGLPLLLNERMPRDNLQVGGFYRWRAIGDKGLFKWGGTWAKTSANGTISDFRTFRTAVNSIPEPPSKYMQPIGEYVNRIYLPFPVGVKRLKLGSVSWSAYPAWDEPGVFMTPKDGLKDLKGGGVAVGITVDGQDYQIGENGQGFSSEVWVDISKKYVDYKVSLTAYAPQGSPATMVSPVFDDITISFYLPKEEVLLTERMTD